MKMIKSLLASLVVVGAGVAAHADATVRPMECALTFKAHGGGVQVLVGKFKLTGTGNIRCVDANGNTEVLPVRVALGGHPVALRAAAGYLSLAGVASGVGYAQSPAALLGRYTVAGAQAAVIVGAGAEVSFHAVKGAVTLNTDVQVTDGLGFQVGISNLVIEAR